MRPEVGNKEIQVTQTMIAEGVRSIGVVPGDVVMFHSALSSMGTVVGGPNTVIDGFLEAVGPEGTVCVPTLWFHDSDPPMRLEDFDVDTSPSYPGLITEVFRQRPDSLRSNNPTHSISAIGARAREITATHGLTRLRPCLFGDGAFAGDSPWQKLYDWNAAYCFLGVDFTVNTMGHFTECVILERALAAAPADQRAQLESEIARWQKPGVYSGFARQATGVRLEKLGLVRFGQIGSATLRCIRARTMVDTLLEILDREPEEWFSEPFQEWLKRAQGKG